MVVVPEDQLSLAIGRAGVNARLAARLTGWRIDIKSLPESASEALQKLASDAGFAEQAEQQAAVIEQVQSILAKKAGGRPVTPEEYQVLTGFVDRVQSALQGRREASRLEREQKLEEIRQAIPAGAYQATLEVLGLSTRIVTLLQEAGFADAGHAMEQLGVDEDKILGINGFGPKSLEELKATLAGFEFPEPEPVAEPEVEAVEALAEPEPEAEAAEAFEALEPEAEEAAAVEAPALAAEPALPAPAADEAELAGGEAVEAIPVVDVEETFKSLVEQIGSAIPIDGEEEQEEEGPEGALAGKKRKKRKKATRQLELDPITGEMVVKRRRKRGGDDWEDQSY
jgi:N utilization substance protein A